MEMIETITSHVDNATYGALLASNKFFMSVLPWKSVDQVCYMLDHLCRDKHQPVADQILKNQNLSSVESKLFLEKALQLDLFELVSLLWSGYVEHSEQNISMILQYCIEKNNVDAFVYFLTFAPDDSSFYEYLLMDAFEDDRQEIIQAFLNSKKGSLACRFHYAVVSNNIPQLRVLYQEFQQQDEMKKSDLHENFEMACAKDLVKVIEWFDTETSILSQEESDDVVKYSGFLTACGYESNDVARYLLREISPDFVQDLDDAIDFYENSEESEDEDFLNQLEHLESNTELLA